MLQQHIEAGTQKTADYLCIHVQVLQHDKWDAKLCRVISEPQPTLEQGDQCEHVCARACVQGFSMPVGQVHAQAAGQTGVLLS